ncbi:kinase-like protein [Athelia psychrophila]|uniref:Kinase-like protein n=1 Tax=Athelia psychrophila TaxID=1759441 RepID=A0A166LEU2_9AGAM|nr:kinase-like protein [Fibularhizoctonia sp. CBS 109695]
MDACDLPPYFPPFLWTYWLSDVFSASLTPDDQRFHVYDVHNNTLSETRRVPQQNRSIFQDFLNQEVLDEHCKIAFEAAEMAFARLEAKAELAFEHLMHEVASSQDRTKTNLASIKRHELETLRRYFVFVRFRNSSQYAFMLSNLVQTVTWENGSGKGVLLSVWHRIRRHRALTSIHAFLQHDAVRIPQPAMTCDQVNNHCWAFMEADIYLGVASEGQEFILTEHCTGNLDDAFRDDPSSCRFFVPLSPTVALYILGDDVRSPAAASPEFQSDFDRVKIECGLESVSDIHLRNTILLQGCPQYIYFSNLLSVAQTIRLYELGSRHAESHTDYSRLMHRAQQKATQEQVTKTLLVKGCLMSDLTDQVVRLGQAPVAHGSFSDIWKGTWTVRDPFNQTVPRKVALKYLRQVMPPGVREKLVHRLKDEVVAWHSLRHDNIAQLFGVIQSFDTIAMISPWCDNGTLIHYIKDVNASADRLALLAQVASGVSYLHNFKPVVIHGDLKGCNILVDDHGHALLTDFGLAKIIEDIAGAVQLATSFFAGSTRWMSPELILALVEDDGRAPPISPSSDVYAFACVCLELATDNVPFPHRSNDHAVTVDIMRGIRPCRGSSSPCRVKCSDEDAFWRVLDQCWDPEHYLRPSMLEVSAFLGGESGLPISYTSNWPS